MAHGDRKEDESAKAGEQPLGGLVDSMANLISRLSDLAEKGEQLKRSGNFQGAEGKEVAGSYGFSVKFGPGGERSDKFQVEPANKPTRKTTESAARQELEKRIPPVDLFVEEDSILVVAEMPGVAVEDVELQIREQTMVLRGRSARVQFEKEVELGQCVSPDDVQVSVNHGVVEVTIQNQPDARSAGESAGE